VLTTASRILRIHIGRAPRPAAQIAGWCGSAGRLGAAVAAMVIVLAGCGSAGAADGSDESAAVTPTPTPTPAAAASLSPMTQPAKPYPQPSMPLKPAKADELTLIGYGVERIVWASAGVVDPTTTVACNTTNAKLVVEKAALRFDCVVTASGVRTTFAISSTTGPKHIAWDFKVARLPVAQKKVEYEMSRQAFKPARVTCDLDGTELVPLGDPDAITCWVVQTDNTSVSYHGGLDDSGVITLTLAPLPSPAATPTRSARTTSSSSTSPTPSSR